MAIELASQYLMFTAFALFYLGYSAGNSRLFRVSDMFRRNELVWIVAVMMWLQASSLSAASSAPVHSIAFGIVLLGLMLQSFLPEVPPASGEWKAQPQWWPTIKVLACCLVGAGFMIRLSIS